MLPNVVCEKELTPKIGTSIAIASASAPTACVVHIVADKDKDIEIIMNRTQDPPLNAWGMNPAMDL